MPATLPNPPAKAEEIVNQEVVIDMANVTVTAKYAVYISVGELEVGLRKRTLLDDRYFQSLFRTATSVPDGMIDFAEELGYPEKLIDDELIDFLYSSSQVVKAVGVEYAAFGDDWATIKRKFAAYIATPGIDELWKQVNKATNDLERNPDPITAPGVTANDPK